MTNSQRVLWILFLLLFAFCLVLWHDHVQPEATIATIFIAVATPILHFVLKPRS